MMSAAQKLLVGFCIILVRTAIAQKRTLIIELQSINCYNYAPEWLKDVGCEMTQRNHTSFGNVYIMLQKPAPRYNVRVVLEYYMATGASIKLLDNNIDGCEYVRQINQQKQINIVYKYIKKFVNKIPVCPVEENFNYTIQDFNMDVNDLPNYLPDITFSIAFYVSELPGTDVALKAVVDGKLRHSNKISGK